MAWHTFGPTIHIIRWLCIHITLHKPGPAFGSRILCDMRYVHTLRTLNSWANTHNYLAKNVCSSLAQLFVSLSVCRSRTIMCMARAYGAREREIPKFRAHIDMMPAWAALYFRLHRLSFTFRGIEHIGCFHQYQKCIISGVKKTNEGPDQTFIIGSLQRECNLFHAHSPLQLWQCKANFLGFWKPKYSCSLKGAVAGRLVGVVASIRFSKNLSPHRATKCTAYAAWNERHRPTIWKVSAVSQSPTALFLRMSEVSQF